MSMSKIDIILKELSKQKNKCNQLLRDYEEVNSSYIKLQQEIEKTEQDGIDVSITNSNLSEYSLYLSNNDFQNASDLISRCFDELTNTKVNYIKSKNKIEEGSNYLEKATTVGLKTSINHSSQLLEKSQEAWKNGNYIDSLSLAQTAVEDIENTLEMKNTAEENISEAKNQIEKASKAGSKLDIANNLLEQAISKYDFEDYKESNEIAITSIEEAKPANIKYSKAANSLDDATELVKESVMYMKISPLVDLLEDAKKALSNDDYNKVLSLSSSIAKDFNALKGKLRPKLEYKIEQEGYVKENWKQIQVYVKNIGQIKAENISFSVPEDSMAQIHRSTTIPSLSSEMEEHIDLMIKFTEGGQIPLKVRFDYTNPWTNKQHKQEKEINFIVNLPDGVTSRTPIESITVSDVKPLSATEFYRGYVRLKVKIANNSEATVNQVALKVLVQEEALRLDRVEPDSYALIGNEVNLGNIQGNEAKTVAFLYDPMICTNSSIEGTLHFKDALGNLKTTTMKSRKVEIVSPVLYTVDNINTAILNRLVTEELKYHDSKIFNLAKSKLYKQILDIAKESIQIHDIKLVREFSDKGATEVWYYGKTKVKENKIVARCSIDLTEKYVELFVASNDQRALTGFLAEIGHDFSNIIKERQIMDELPKQITNITIKDSVINRSTLLFSDEDTDIEIEGSIINRSKTGE